MSSIIRFFLLCLMAGNVLAQSSLPACKGSDFTRWTYCVQTLIYPNGNKYVGEWRNGKHHGQGTMNFANGDIRVGEFAYGFLHGLGTAYTHATGERHVGRFHNDSPKGLGIRYSPSGSIIEQGNWEKGKAKSFAVDVDLFPFNLSVGAIHASVPDPLKAERDRLTSEVEAERRKRQELQAELDRAKELAESRLTERPRPQSTQRSERRVALVIGNAQYKSSPLENAVNDATDIDQALKRFGFQTTFLRNASLSQMREATRRFADQLTNADVALIYFAGHGIESKNKNFMIPVNADLKFEYELVDQAYDAAAWLEMLEMIKSNNAERVNIVILDACRNNNLIGSRSLNRGLARMDAPTGTFLSYSTAPGKVAADGGRGERNSPFTKNLLRAMQQPGQPIEEVFKEVRRNVTRETNGAQVPWESTSLTGYFSFRNKN